MKKMAMYEHAECCGTVLKDSGLCECERMYVSCEDRCSKCGERLYRYNDPSLDYSMSEYCTSRICNYYSNQFIDLDDDCDPLADTSSGQSVKSPIESIIEINYSENETIGVVLYEIGKYYIVDLLVYNRYTDKCKVFYTVSIPESKKGSRHSIRLIVLKIVEWIESNKSKEVSIDTILDIEKYMGEEYEEILKLSEMLFNIKGKIYSKITMQMEEARVKYNVIDDAKGILELMVNRGTREVYGVYSYANQSKRITDKFSLGLFSEEELIQYCKSRGYVITLN